MCHFDPSGDVGSKAQYLPGREIPRVILQKKIFGGTKTMYELVGYRKVEIQDGNSVVRGYSCWFLVDEDGDFQGRSGVKVFFSYDKYPDFAPVLGDKYLLIFNQKGKLHAYQKLDS